ncbi:LOW QUALITY PROTEIN: hypothetical protein ACHAWF_016473 [Thalassiosira exigua]
MVHRHIGTPPSIGVQIQQAPYEILGLIAEAVTFHLVLARPCVLENGIVGPSVERGSSSEQYVRDHPYAPEVARSIVASVEQLRRHIVRSADRAGQRTRLGGVADGKAEVDELDGRLVVAVGEQYVLGLDVSVDDVLGVEATAERIECTIQAASRSWKHAGGFVRTLVTLESTLRAFLLDLAFATIRSNNSPPRHSSVMRCTCSTTVFDEDSVAVLLDRECSPSLQVTTRGLRMAFATLPRKLLSAAARRLCFLGGIIMAMASVEPIRLRLGNAESVMSLEDFDCCRLPLRDGNDCLCLLLVDPMLDIEPVLWL